MILTFQNDQPLHWIHLRFIYILSIGFTCYLGALIVTNCCCSVLLHHSFDLFTSFINDHGPHGTNNKQLLFGWWITLGIAVALTSLTIEWGKEKQMNSSL